ncbi:MAG: hypothetical protein B0D92_02840 [Spirochaeta sp. LUC14_002_19_P3]|nr:MAG: hypothetical protein B0D92_02840 [Spirochaeta sp. LUC14_002_19_P3]
MKAAEEGARTVAVEGVLVKKGFLVEEVRSAGVAEGIQEAWIISETEGLIRELRFQLGDAVKAGAVLLTVDNELAARNRELAEGQYQTALLEFQAAKNSKESGSISALQFSQTSDRLLAAKASLAAAADAYNNTYIKAPFSGAIAYRSRDLGPGNYLSRGVRIARVVDYSAFRAEFSVGEGQILLVREGAAVAITAGDGLVRSGRVSAVSAGSDGSTGGFTVLAEWRPLANDPLKSGMSVDAAIRVEGEAKHIIAPASAMRIREGEKYFFVDKDGKAEPRRVTTGSRLGERIEVISGLEEGDVVAASGIASLTPGTPIAVSIIKHNETSP